MGNASKHKYKFQHLKFYCNKQGLYNSKNFRQVFVNEEVGYLYAELALFNILFDEEDWEAKIEFKGYSVSSSNKEKEVFSISNTYKIPKTTNIHYCREGYGNPNKTFWKKGHYRWKAYIEGEFIAENDVYIEDGGLVTNKVNPYFDVQNVQFYTIDDDNKSKYLDQFTTEGTKFIYTSLSLKNKISKSWKCELEFMYLNEQNQMIAYFNTMKTVSSKTTVISHGWGSTSGDWWKEGQYTAKVLFMGKLIAVSKFKVGAKEIEKSNDSKTKDFKIVQNTSGTTSIEEDVVEEKSLDELLADFNQLVGLQNIKNKITQLISYINFEKLRKEKGLKAQSGINLHSVFTGNPGTGKTTVAKKMGAIYKAIGLLSEGHVHEVDRADLLGEYIGQTAPRTKKEIEKARGGILFIDEAYSLNIKESPKDYGHEAIELILKEMSDGPGDLVVIVAGYPKEMHEFINSNPGLKSRFNTYFEFEDYLPEELMEITTKAIKSKGFEITPEAKTLLEEHLTRRYRQRDASFGNARYAISLIEGAKMNLALRLSNVKDLNKLSQQELSTFTIQDVQSMLVGEEKKKLHLTIDEPKLQEAMIELELLIGLDNIKQEIRELVKLVRYYNEIGKDVLNTFVLHTVFTGNPGTGKTTLARIFAKIFNGLGILEKGHLVECDRAQLVGEYLGQTAPKTLAMIEAAIGGVLFIDEAYSLVQSDSDSFGKEAISTLLKQMEDRNKEFVLIVAGYPHNMDVFLKANPGLKSRFEQTMHFEDYDVNQLISIAELMFKKEGLSLASEAREGLTEYLSQLLLTKDEHFGNAREVRKAVQEITRYHHLRMADLNSNERTPEMISKITQVDVEKLELPNKGHERKTMGFKFGD